VTSRGRRGALTLVVTATLSAAVAIAGAGCGHKPPTAGPSAPIAVVTLPKVGAEAQAEFNEGLRTMKMGRKHYKDARQHLQKATQIDPHLFEAWHNLGVLEAAMGNYDKSIESFRRALDIQPGSRKTLLAFGETLRRAHKAKDAARLYAKWLESDPNDGDMRARYSQMLREAGELEESLEQVRILLGQGGQGDGSVGQTVIAYNALGLTYYKMGKLDLAETALRKAAELDAKSAFVWNNLGLVAFERGHDQEAFLHFQKASELDPKYVQARLNKAVVFLDCGDYKRARAELERAVEIDPNDADAQVALGVAARGEGKLDLARRAYERALDIEPDYPAALWNLAILYMDYDKDKVKAKDYLAQFKSVADSTDPKRADADARLKELAQ
jgi:tetratricopeptide (TPR) repeat protein